MIIHVPLQIRFVPDLMFPEPALPDSVLALSDSCGRDNCLVAALREPIFRGGSRKIVTRSCVTTVKKHVPPGIYPRR